MTDIYQEALKVMKPEHIDHHESDLYLKVNEESTKLVNKYEWKCNVTKFNSAFGDGIWYDIPFAFTPFWSNRKIYS